MSLELVVSNPPKSNRRGKSRKHRNHKKRRKMSAAQKKYFSKRSAAPVAKHKKGRSRRSHRRARRGSGGLGSILGGGGGLSLIPSMTTIKSAAASVGGFWAVNKAVEKLQEKPDSSFRDTAGQFPWKTVGVKMAVATVGASLLGKTVGREMAQAFAIGGMTAAGLDVLAHIKASGNAGLGYTDEDNTNPIQFNPAMANGRA